DLKVVSDFRSYLAELEKCGLITRFNDEVDWDLEAGAIMRYCDENQLPAQWFTRIKDSLPGSSLVGGLYATYERIAVALGLPADTDYPDLVDYYGEALRQRIPPRIVDSGACQENVLTGDDIDLFRFPIPRTHENDGGPFGRFALTVNTGVCKDPDSDWVNWGTYRGQIQSKDSTGLALVSQNHGGKIWAKYNERKQVMEYASFQGGDPLYFLVAASGVPFGDPEVDVVGGMRGRPVELVKCKTVDLYVPADAEFVVEGTITPGDLMEEGPFGEYPGYTVSECLPRPVLRISAITHRNDPILTTTCLGIPHDDGIIWGLQLSGVIKKALQDKGLPVVKVAAPAESGWHSIVVSTRTPHGGIPQQIAYTVWTDRVGSFFPYVVVVDEDVDPAKLGEVYHAICTKCEPQRDIHIQRNTSCSPLTPYVRKSAEKDDGYGGSNVLLDCTWPFDWSEEETPIREAFNTSYPEAVKQQAMAQLRKAGLV
ncbi:MAG: UbiD family decarboxylase, partial [Pseudomonadota bacterium]|nr:UbiD family decarboxylase [Pseudomonadota bacterium]